MHKLSGQPPNRAGFTLIELVIALIMVGIIAGVTIPRIDEARRAFDMNRAVRTVAMDLEQSLALAARQRAPVQIVQPGGSFDMEIRNAADGTVYLNRDFEDGSSGALDGFTVVPSPVTIFPTGRTSGLLTVTLESGDRTQSVTMSTAGRVLVLP
jgi:prepilin-type N-terminal cleavage/methylation domain-containing protein